MAVKDDIKRASAAKERKTVWDTELQDCYHYIIPGRDAFYEQVTGERDNEDIFDDTAPNALKRFAGTMQSALVKPYTRWAELVPGSDVDEAQETEIKKALAPITEILMKAIWQSNFDSQVLEMFYDLGIGTGALLVLEGEDSQDPLRFEAVPMNELFPEEAASGMIETCFRFYKMPGRALLRQWPKGDLGPKLQKVVDSKPDEQIPLIEGVIFEPKTKKTQPYYRYVVIAKEYNHEIYSQKMNTSPWVIPRMDTRPGEILGRGPGWTMLPTIKTVNQIVKYSLINAEMAVSNVYMVQEDGVLNIDNITMEPNSIIPVVSTGGTEGPAIAPLQRNGDFNLSNLILADLQNQIREAFFDGQLGEIDDPVKSATEISIRNQIRLQQMGAQIGRLQTELIDKLVKRVYDILSGFKLVPKDLKVDGKQIAVGIEGSIAKSQRVEDGQNYLAYLQTIAGLAPQILPIIVEPKQLVWLAETFGVPSDQVPSESELTSKLENLAKAQQATQQPAAVEPQS